MRFLTLYRSVEKNTPPTTEEMAAMGQHIEEQTKAGVFLSGEGYAPSAMGARVRLANGKVTVTDGPFTESKEVIGGFAILQASSKAEVIEHVKKFLEVGGDGETEIRLLQEESDFAPA